MAVYRKNVVTGAAALERAKRSDYTVDM